jgi:hypothetical protein
MRAGSRLGGLALSVLVVLMTCAEVATAEQIQPVPVRTASQAAWNTTGTFTDQKLDLILEKLGKLEERMDRLEKQMAVAPADSSPSWIDLNIDLSDAVEWLQSCLGIGYFVEQYSSDPNRRMSELIKNSKDLQEIEMEWDRIWYTDQPSHMTPERVHGGIQ